MKTKEKHQLLRLMNRILLLMLIYNQLVQSSPNVTLTYHSSYVFSLAFDSANGYLASGSDDNKIAVWSLDGESWSFNKYLDNINPAHALAQLPNSKLASSSLQNILLWDPLNSATPTETQTGHTSKILGNLLFKY
jgi:WD40 repeat protein